MSDDTKSPMPEKPEQPQQQQKIAPTPRLGELEDEQLDKVGGGTGPGILRNPAPGG